MSFVRDEQYYYQGRFKDQKLIREQLTNRRPMSENGTMQNIKQEYRNVQNTPEYNKMFNRNIPYQQRNVQDIVSLNIINNNNLDESTRYKILQKYKTNGEKLFDDEKYGKYNVGYQNWSHLPFEDSKQMIEEMEARIKNKKDIEDDNEFIQHSMQKKFYRVNSADSYQYIMGKSDKGRPPKVHRGIIPTNAMIPPTGRNIRKSARLHSASNKEK